MPEEETTVLVYLNCDHVTLGVMIDGTWETTVAPWELTPGDGAEVLYWCPLLWPLAKPAGAREPAATLKLVQGIGPTHPSSFDSAAGAALAYPDVHSLRTFDADVLDRTLAELGDRAGFVTTRRDFADFLAHLLRSTDAGARYYRGVPVWPLIDALLWCVEDFDYYFQGRALYASEHPDWQLFAQILFMGLFRGTPATEERLEQQVTDHNTIG